jgi:hypothetical protein
MIMLFCLSGIYGHRYGTINNYFHDYSVKISDLGLSSRTGAIHEEDAEKIADIVLKRLNERGSETLNATLDDKEMIWQIDGQYDDVKKRKIIVLVSAWGGVSVVYSKINN